MLEIRSTHARLAKSHKIEVCTKITGSVTVSRPQSPREASRGEGARTVQAKEAVRSLEMQVSELYNGHDLVMLI